MHLVFSSLNDAESATVDQKRTHMTMHMIPREPRGFYKRFHEVGTRPNDDLYFTARGGWKTTNLEVKSTNNLDAAGPAHRDSTNLG